MQSISLNQFCDLFGNRLLSKTTNPISVLFVLVRACLSSKEGTGTAEWNRFRIFLNNKTNSMPNVSSEIRDHGPRSYNENIETKLSFSTGPCLACLGFASTCTFVQSYIATYEWGGTGSPSLKNCPSSCGFLSSSTHR